MLFGARSYSNLSYVQCTLTASLTACVAAVIVPAIVLACFCGCWGLAYRRNVGRTVLQGSGSDTLMHVGLDGKKTELKLDSATASPAAAPGEAQTPSTSSTSFFGGLGLVPSRLGLGESTPLMKSQIPAVATQHGDYV